jgi:hypothetical protein
MAKRLFDGENGEKGYRPDPNATAGRAWISAKVYKTLRFLSVLILNFLLPLRLVFLLVQQMDFIFGNTTIPTWTIVIVALLNIPVVVPRSLLTTVHSQYVGGQLHILDSNVHDLELYIFEIRDHLPVFLRMQAIEPELEK